MLADELAAAARRSAATVGAPITVRSALDRTAAATVAPGTERHRGGAAPGEGEDAGEDGAPEWPDEAVESAMRAEIADREVAPAPAARRARSQRSDTLEGGPLPPLEELVGRIPAGVREILEDLYRAQFQGVRRIPAAVLKAAAAPAGAAAAEPVEESPVAPPDEELPEVD